MTTLRSSTWGSGNGLSIWLEFKWKGTHCTVAGNINNVRIYKRYVLHKNRLYSAWNSMVEILKNFLIQPIKTTSNFR